MLMRSRFTNHVALRMLSYAIDTTLLTAALMLITCCISIRSCRPG